MGVLLKFLIRGAIEEINISWISLRRISWEIMTILKIWSPISIVKQEVYRCQASSSNPLKFIKKCMKVFLKVSQTNLLSINKLLNLGMHIGGMDNSQRVNNITKERKKAHKNSKLLFIVLISISAPMRNKNWKTW